jgi:hypothetical protein
MGIALWIASGILAWVAARLLPAGRDSRWLIELLLAICASALLGLVATSLDFAGWKEPDWRAGLFVFFGALATLGVFRLVTIFRRRPLQ